jgi:hypothetical protein
MCYPVDHYCHDASVEARRRRDQRQLPHVARTTPVRAAVE